MTPSMLVAHREVIQRVRRRSFAAFTAILFIVIIAGGVVASVVGDDSPTTYDVGVTSSSAASAESFAVTLTAVGDATDIEIDTVIFPAAGPGTDALAAGDIDVVVDLDARAETWQTAVDARLETLVDTGWRAWSAAVTARQAGLDDAQISSIIAPDPLSSTVVEPSEDDTLGILVGFASAILLFISITSFGNYVLTGVVEEKSTGVVEVLLSHVRAHELMAGKVVGIGLVALLQFAASIVAALIALSISGVDVPSDIWVGLPATIAWFIGGFLLYSTLYALAGSFVSRMEDAQSAAAPIQAAFTVGYLLVFTFGNDPTGTVARVLSILPPFSPLLMPLRMVTGAASVVEIVVAAVLLALSVVGMIRLAGSVYSRTLLHRGTRLRWRDAFGRQEPAAAD